MSTRKKGTCLFSRGVTKGPYFNRAQKWPKMASNKSDLLFDQSETIELKNKLRRLGIMSENFHKILKERLEGENLSAISKQLDIPNSLLHDWHSAKRLPSMKNIEAVKRLADYLGLTLEELFIEDTSKNIITSLSFKDEDKEYRILIERIK